jgi:hypothetical protein
MERFNYLFNHVTTNWCTPVTADMEEGLLSYLKSHKQSDEDQSNVRSPVRGSALPENMQPTVETFWMTNWNTMNN